MSSRSPRVSVGMPLYNAQRFLGETLDSILGQTFPDFELVISDNGSSDRTEEICRDYAARDARIRYYRNEVNRGAAWNHNHVFELSQGEYFKWASFDDLLAPTFLEKCVAVLDSQFDVVLCFTKFRDFDDYGTRIGAKSSKSCRCATKDARFRALIYKAHTCEEIYGVIRTLVLRKTPLIGYYTSSDQNLLAELALHGRFYEVPEVLFFHRWHAASTYRLWPNHAQRWIWFDPSAEGRVVFPYWRQCREFVSTLHRSPVDLGERLRCYYHIGSWMKECRRQLLGDAFWGLRALAIRGLKAHLPWVRKAYSTLTIRPWRL